MSVSHRTATPLELLFDLTFVVAFGMAADGLVVLSLSPWVVVVGYELRGHEHNARVIAQLT